MTPSRLLGFLLGSALLCTACGRNNPDDTSLLRSPEVKKRESRFQRALDESGVDSGNAKGAALARWVLPKSLNEVSGLTLAPDGRLFAHGDESGMVAALDYRSGVLLKEFIVGKNTNSIDFEGITAVGDTLFMVTSDGDLYEFREGAPGEHVKFALHETDLKKECEFEGVAYNQPAASLLLACKNVKDDKLRDSVVIFQWKLQKPTDGSERITRFSMPLSSFTTPLQTKDLHPSDIAVDPTTGNYLMVAAQEKAIMEFTPAGEVIYARRIPDEHEQAEGLAITKDGVIIIGDEAVHSRATLTLYRKPD
jgi:uncharacterized protein YjiK